MKSGKSITYTILLFMSFCLYSCNGSWFGNQETENDDSLTHSESKTDKSVIAVTDSVNNLKDKFIDLESQFHKTTQKIDHIETDIKSFTKNKANNTLWLLIGCGLGIISLIIAIAAITKVGKYKLRLDCHRNEIKALKSKLSEYKHTDNNSRSNYSVSKFASNSEYSSLQRKIQSLEDEMTKMKSTILSNQVVPPVTTPEVPIAKPQAVKIGYFGTVVSGEGGTGYFKKMLEYKDEDARFLVKFLEKTIEFEPIATLPMIKSSDYMELAVEFKGCSKSEATDMALILPGIVEQNGDKWIIKKKASVDLLK